MSNVKRTKATRVAHAPASRITDNDLYLFNEGTHARAYDVLGAHPLDAGTHFAVWAPAAAHVDVVGDFNDWAGTALSPRADSGIWEGVLTEAGHGSLYKFRIRSQSGETLEKTDPYGRFFEVAPKTSAIVWDLDHAWSDQAWMSSRGPRNALDAPISVYEMHLGSWRHRTGARESLSYRELAEPLADHILSMGFTHVEFLPVTEHPFYGSWGYQSTGFFAPTSRFGTPQDFMFLVDHLHQRNIGVILDWVPSHFPTDEWSLGRFDGTHLYEHADPSKAIHPDWGSYVFNFGRNEVRSFLLSSALFWLDAYHIDGLRADAVASMLYLDYSRKPGEWTPNEHGGREDLDAIAFLRQANETIYAHHPDVQTIAEESTAWPGVSRPTYLGGLGFGMKWDMGWMHDTLQYFQKDPIHRTHHHHNLTFRMVYAFSENFILPLSHDEVVHGKGSLLRKMPGDRWRKFANLRALYGWMWGHPGKQLLFMGQEFGQDREWSEERELDWWLLEDPDHLGLQRLVADMNRVYRAHPALWRRDSDPTAFHWIDANNADANLLSFHREGADGDPPVAVIANLSTVPLYDVRFGLPAAGRWDEVLNTDSSAYGGADVGNMGGVQAVDQPWHGKPTSALVTCPPLGVVWLRGPSASGGPTASG